MDPRGQQLKRHATHMLQFNPGTDVALLNAMLNVIIEESLYDRQYVEANTEGFENLKHHIKDFTPEAMQDICGIDATPSALWRACLRDRAERAIIFWGMGISQSVHGTDNARCLIALSMITGQVGRPGTGLHPLRGQNNVQGASDAGLIPMMFPDYQAVDAEAVRKRFEDAWGTSSIRCAASRWSRSWMPCTTASSRASTSWARTPPCRIRTWITPAEALAKLEHLVVQDIFLTETAFHADVVLPASAWPEKDGTVTNSNRQVQMGRKAR